MADALLSMATGPARHAADAMNTKLHKCLDIIHFVDGKRMPKRLGSAILIHASAPVNMFCSLGRLMRALG